MSRRGGADPDTIVEAIRSRDAIVVPVLSVKTTDGPDWPSCGLASTLPSALEHWTLADTKPTVKVAVPDDFAVADVFEVGPGVVSDVTDVWTVSRTVTFGGVALSNVRPGRIFVLAGSKSVRQSVAAAMVF